MTNPLRTRSRITSIDLLRGLVMIIMALDHTRDFFHIDAWTRDPLDPETTSLGLFFTRWITHFCAPVFVFLAGSSAYLQSLYKSKPELSVFLITRGLWLILVEVIVINFAFSFDPEYYIIGLQVIWAIGISMVILGLLCWLPIKVLLPISLLIIFGHNLLNDYENGKNNFSFIYALLHKSRVFSIGGDRSILVLYPFLPWLGVMIAGYCFATLFNRFEGAVRRRTLMRFGLLVFVFFIFLRITNVYGDSQQWESEGTAMRTLFSFLNTEKYPPSLLYICMTLGPAIFLLGFWDKARSKLADFISVYGRVPFFYYILHFFLIHLLSMLAFFTRGHQFSDGINNDLPNFIIAGEGYNLWVVYVVWILVVLSLYPLCAWYDKYKKNHRQHKLLSYL